MRFGERVFETTDTEGTGAYALAGAAAGHQTFLDGIGAGTYVAYIATDGSNWEVGAGTLTSGPATLTREEIFDSSNAGAEVNWGPGTKNIYCAPIAAVLTSLLKTHIGTAAPAWLPIGALWVDSTTTPWLLKIVRSGGSTTLGRIDATNNRFVVEGAKAADIVSAGSIDIGAATGDFVHITGTTTITALGTANQGVERTLVFDGALTLTHNATSLILFDAANIITAAGRVVRVRSEGAGNWRQVGGYRAITSALLPAATTVAQGAVELATEAETLAMTDPDRAVTPAGLASFGAPVLLETLATTSGSSVTTGTLPACRAFLILLAGVSGSGTAALEAYISANDGGSYSGNFMPTGTQGSAYSREGKVEIFGTGVTGNKPTHAYVGAAAGGEVGMRTTLVTSVTGVINKIAFAMSAGNFDAGAIYVFGFR